jgi:hypothetical protein
MESLTFTSGSFMQCTVATSSRIGGTIYDIMTATSSVDRRVYGISVVSNDNNVNPVKIFLNDGTKDIQICNVNVVANSGNAVGTPLTDVFSSTMAESVFAKTRDANGVTYFNLPKNWSIRMSYLTTHTIPAERLYTFVFGENY